LDTALFYWFYGDGHGALGATMIGLSAVGSGWSMLGLPPLLALRRTRGVAGWLTVSLLVTSLAVFLLKLGFGRARPCAALPDVHAIAFVAPTDPSFPSGHAAGTACFAAFLAVLVLRSAWPLWARATVVSALVALALGVGLSRVYLGVHFPLDVGAGAVLGAIVGVLFGLRATPRSIHTAGRA
jgi:undecaprenyl-diphosphatase